MEELLLNTFIITCCVVFVEDISGFVPVLKDRLRRLLTGGRFRGSDWSIKPFDCSLCMSFWCCLAYVIYKGHLSVASLGVCFMMSYLSTFVRVAMVAVSDFYNYLINKAYGKR